jgi:hypothetical protein
MIVSKQPSRWRLLRFLARSRAVVPVIHLVELPYCQENRRGLAAFIGKFVALSCAGLPTEYHRTNVTCFPNKMALNTNLSRFRQKRLAEFRDCGNSSPSLSKFGGKRARFRSHTAPPACGLRSIRTGHRCNGYWRRGPIIAFAVTNGPCHRWSVTNSARPFALAIGR